MNAYPAKVGRTVTYRTATGRVRPAVITAVIDATHADLRVGRRDKVTNATGNPPPDGIPDEVYLNVARRSGNRGAGNVNWNNRWSV